MANTDNLKLEVINSSDFVSPDPINENFKKVDALGIDYVIEQGTSGEWWYRKWKCGRMECGVDNKNFGSAKIDIPWGGVYAAYVSFTFGAYPIAFVSNPTVIIFPSNVSSGYSFNIAINASTSPKTMSPIFDLWRGTSLGQIDNIQSCIYVTGRYK